MNLRFQIVLNNVGKKCLLITNFTAVASEASTALARVGEAWCSSIWCQLSANSIITTRVGLAWITCCKCKIQDNTIVSKDWGKTLMTFRKFSNGGSGWHSGILPRFSPLGPQFNPPTPQGHYVDWVFSPCLIAWVFWEHFSGVFLPYLKLKRHATAEEIACTGRLCHWTF